MEVIALSRYMAEKRIPKSPELLIGILDSQPHGHVQSHVVADVPESKLRVAYETFTFDDIEVSGNGKVMFDKFKANRIFDVFLRYRNEIEVLAFHCREGLSRSTALAAAFNHRVPGLIADQDYMRDCPANMLVYDIMYETIERRIAELV